ncbi:MAG: aldehyde dehydrogenase family protein [Hyphomicrobiaceae bacterium]|nr:aldehyde dehydrogenase family protein [Hyphomicrobiaceae bacterium]
MSRYYAHEARQVFAGPRLLKGPTGERNTLMLRGRGRSAAISPWNFPLAIFIGRMAVAAWPRQSGAGKTAEQSPITATLAVAIVGGGRAAGCLHLLPGEANRAALVKDARVRRAVHRISNETAWTISECWPTDAGQSYRSSPRLAASTR